VTSDFIFRRNDLKPFVCPMCERGLLVQEQHQVDMEFPDGVARKMDGLSVLFCKVCNTAYVSPSEIMEKKQ